jgi:2-dehydro-3-deoxyphosphogluconate aldolase/(4S)-4-hydroxy-2-oxoglutarate aldolase
MAMTRAEVKARIIDIGIIPAVRTASAEEARFAAETVASAGIPIVEITMTIPGAIEVIAYLAQHTPDVIIGAGTVLDTDTAHQCLKAGAQFLTGPGLELTTMQLAHTHDVTILAGALTPTEIIGAWKAGADFVKVFPCAAVGGDAYIRALKGPFPKIPLIAAGGVNQTTASNFILAGASALGIGAELIPRQAIQKRQSEQIRELAKRFLRLVGAARARLAPRPEEEFAHG